MNPNEFEGASVTQTEAAAPKKRLRSLFARGEKAPFDGYVYIAAFLVPFLILLGVYACLGKHPFGNGSVLTLDLQAQYVYYFEAIRRLLTEGGSWLYSFERTLGGEFMGIVSYYCASPFNLVFALFPKSMMADAVMFMQLLKVGTMGLTFAYYLKKTRKTDDMLTVGFSIMYALSAYSVVQLMNPMWLDGMVFLPLLVLGIESMIRERRFALYTISLVTVFVTNYYIGYMCAIFTFFYYLYYYFLVRDELPQNAGAMEGGRFKKLICSRGFETLMRFGVFSVLAAVISAFMLLTAWYSLQFGKTDFSNPDFSPTLRFDFLDVFVKLLPGSYDTVRPNGLPMIYSGMLALLAFPLFFLSKTISSKKKILTAGLMLFFVVSFSVNTVDLVWHGFSAPNWLNYRYSFLFSFVLIVMACDAIRGLRSIPFKWIAGVGTAMAVLVLIVQKLGYSFEQTETRNKELDDAKCIIVSLVLIAIYLFVLHAMKQKNMERAGAMALAIIICVEMFATSIIAITDVQMDVGTVKYDNYLSDNGKTEYYNGYEGAIRRIEDVVNEVLENDTGLYRMESTVYRREGGVNEPMAFGFNGISHSTSTLNQDVIDFMRVMGYASTAHWTKYLGGTPISDALLGIKYVVTKDDKLDSNFYTVAAEGSEQHKYIPTDSTIYAMQNTKALSLAYGVSPMVEDYLADFNKPPYRSALAMQNELINVMLSEVMEMPNVLRGIYAEFDAVDCDYESYSHNHKYIDSNGEQQLGTTSYHVFTPEKGKTEARVKYVFEAEDDGPIYFHVAGIIFQGAATDCQIYCNGRKVSNYFTNETWTVQEIGTFEKGDRVVVELRFSNGQLYYSSEDAEIFYSVDLDAANEAFAQLEYASMYVEEHGNDYIKGTIELPEGQELIFTTIPYDKGWKVKLDGEYVETVEVLGTLLAVPATAGFHEIEFVYRPAVAVYGGMLSVFGILVFIALLFFSVYAKTRGRQTANGGRVHFIYHKGDETLGWCLEDAEILALEAEEEVLPLIETAEAVEAPEEGEAAEAAEATEEAAALSEENEDKAAAEKENSSEE